MIETPEEIARQAEDAFASEPVRTVDAIHLASALFLRRSFPAFSVVTADERVRANASRFGFALPPKATAGNGP